MFRLVALQILMTVVVSAGAWLFGGLHAGISAALGGLACVVPNALFALRLTAVARHATAVGDPSGGRHVAAFFVGEFVKVGLTIGLLVLIAVAYKDLVWLALIIAVVAVLKSYVFAAALMRV